MPRKQDPAKANTIPRRKNFLYKNATFAVQPFGKTFEECLNEAWATTSKVSGRKQVIDDGNEASIITNYRSQVHGMTFFEVLAFTPGMKAMAAKIDLDQTSIDVEDVEVKNDKGQKLQLIENMAHFGVSKNHVIILPSQALRSPELEGHLNWLLHKAAVLDEKQKALLANRIKPDKEAQIRTAKEIHFSTELSMQPADDPKTAMKLFRPAGKNWAGVKALLQGLAPKMGDVADELELSGLTESTPIDIDIFLKWPRPPKDKSHAAMDKIATGLRHLDTELDYEIKTKNGKLTKDDFILQKPRTIYCRGERPVRDLLFKSMHDWLAELLTTKEIV